MTTLASTLVRSLNKDKEIILMMIQDVGERGNGIDYTVKLHEDEGEILITLLMTDEQIEESVAEAVNIVFPGKSSSNVFVKNEYISFKIE